VIGSTQTKNTKVDFDPETQSEIDEMLPLVFQNKNEASKKHCFFYSLKTRGRLNGICKVFFGNEMFIGVYDLKNDGSWKRQDLLIFPAFVENGSLDIVDLLGDGTYFLRTISDGNRGTGEYQSLLTLSGWDGKKFVPVLMETNTFENNNGGEIHYKATFKFENLKTEDVVVLIDVQKKIVSEEEDPKDKDGVIENKSCEHWREKLKWNKRNFSFYDPDLEKNKIQRSKFYDQKHAQEMRLKFMGKRPDLYNLSYEDLDELGIMM
jgi:hypothetical protein